MKIPDLTYKIVAIPSLPEAENIEEAIDWAIEMIEYGYESPTLFILASEQTPVNYFEIVDYIKKVLKELNIPIKEGTEGINSYAYYYILQLSKGIDVRENLSQVYYYNSKIENINDFSLLHWAWDDFKYQNIEEQENDNHYWKGANINTIEQVVIDTAKKWIKENQIDIFNIQ